MTSKKCVMYKICAVAGTLFAFATSTAFAQVDENDNAEGFYVGGGFGDFSTKIDELDDIDNVGIDLDEDEDATKIFAGWRFNQFVAAQADYYDFGDSRAALGLLPVSSEASGIAPSVVGTFRSARLSCSRAPESSSTIWK